MARFKFFLASPNAATETPIFLSITYDGNRAKLKTKQAIKPKAWHKGKVKKNWTEFADVQVELDRIEIIAKNGIKELIEQFNIIPPTSELKKILEVQFFGVKDLGKNDSFWEFFIRFIEKLPSRKSPKTGRPISKNTVESYNQTFNALKKFEDQTGNIISFITLSNDLYDNLVNFFESSLGFVPNTVGKHIKNFKSVINFARDHNGIQVSSLYRDKYWKVQKQIRVAEEIVFLNEHELNELWELDLSSNPIQEKARNLFLVGAWTALRISDIVNLRETHLSEDKSSLTIRAKKTDKTVTVPVHPIILKILEKYDGNMPKLAEPTVNKKIKEVCQGLKSMEREVSRRHIQGKTINNETNKRFEKVTTHTARRSFASNMYRREMPVHYIMAMTGHKKEQDFFRYIGVTNDEVIKSVIEKFKKWYD